VICLACKGSKYPNILKSDFLRFSPTSPCTKTLLDPYNRACVCCAGQVSSLARGKIGGVKRVSTCPHEPGAWLTAVRRQRRGRFAEYNG
jgi:hypothetical protein